MLAVVGPPLCMVVLAATAAERVHGKERTTVVDSRMMVFRIAYGVIGAGDIPQCFEIGHYSCG